MEVMEKINEYVSKYGYFLEESIGKSGSTGSETRAQFIIKGDGNTQEGKAGGVDEETEDYAPAVREYARDLREILIGKLSGIRICRYSLKIAYGEDFVLKHKYSSIPCLMENASELAGNLAAAIVVKSGEEALPEDGLDFEFNATLEDANTLEVTCEDLASVCTATGAQLKFADPCRHIATLVRPEDCERVILTLRFTVAEGSGLLDADGENESPEEKCRAKNNESDEKIYVPTGARYQPTMRCAVVPTDDGCVKMEIETDGSRTPREALLEAASRLASPRVHLDRFKEDASS
jgi:DNA-directed RNA polymerase alpha subunit